MQILNEYGGIIHQMQANWNAANVTSSTVIPFICVIIE